MRFIIVSGMSGAGKTTTLNMFEDLGFFCVENLPVILLAHFGEMAADRRLDVNEIAVGVDIRNEEMQKTLCSQLEILRELGIVYEIVFIDADDKTLVKRYKETRRTHPLAGGDRIEAGISRERELVSFIRKEADFIIDTSSLLTRELKKEIELLCSGETQYGNFIITMLSFGFKNGIPADADIVFDVRFLPNPYYEPELRTLTGMDFPVQKYVMENGDGRIFVEKTTDLMEFLIPRYMDEGKNNLVVGIGCTGGCHRSVTIANALSDSLKKLPYTVRVEHRDMERDLRIKGHLT